MVIGILQHSLIQVMKDQSFTYYKWINWPYWDFINIYNGAGDLLQSLTGLYGSAVIFSDDNGITVEFDSDGSVSEFNSSWTVACVDDSIVMGCTMNQHVIIIHMQLLKTILVILYLAY